MMIASAPTSSAQHRSIRDRVGLVFARAIQSMFHGFPPLIVFAWIVLGIAALTIVLFLFGAVMMTFTMGVSGDWTGLEALGVMFIAVLVRTLPLLAFLAVILWINDYGLYWFHPRLPRDPRARHGV